MKQKRMGRAIWIAFLLAALLTLTAMAPGTHTPAHSMDDTADKVSEEALSRAIAIAIRLAEEIDGKKEEREEEPALLSAERKYKLSRY